MIAKRLALLNKGLKTRRIDALLVTNSANVGYLSGFAGSDSNLLVTSGRNYLFTDSRYIEEVRKNARGFEVRLVSKSMYDDLEDVILKEKIKRIGFEAMNLPYAVWDGLKNFCGKAELVPVKKIVEGIRAVKDKGEICHIRSSIKLAGKVLDKISAAIKPGAAESDISRAAEMEFIKNGARLAYDAIIASGKNSSMPHARPGSRRISANDFIMIDIGCNLNGYCSDFTRMFVLGKPPARFVKMCDIVRAAQEKAIDSVRPGVLAANIDFIARSHIRDKGCLLYTSLSPRDGLLSRMPSSA